MSQKQDSKIETDLFKLFSFFLLKQNIFTEWIIHVYEVNKNHNFRRDNLLQKKTHKIRVKELIFFYKN